MPTVIKTAGNVQLLNNQFGYCVRESFRTTKAMASGERERKQVRIYHINITPHLDIIRAEPSNGIAEDQEQFFKVEALGTSCSPKCGGCRCGKCSPGMADYTLKQKSELALIQPGLKYDGKDLSFTISYPFIKDPVNLPNSVNIARAKLRSTDRRLGKLSSDFQQAYQSQIMDMEQRGNSRKLTDEEMLKYKGSVSYIHYHQVFKPNSVSTPVSVVSNSPVSFMGHVLNDYWVEGPDFINNSFGILLRFR